MSGVFSFLSKLVHMDHRPTVLASQAQDKKELDLAVKRLAKHNSDLYKATDKLSGMINRMTKKHKKRNGND